MKLLKRLFGVEAPAGEALEPEVSRKNGMGVHLVGRRVTLRDSVARFVRIDELDLFGPVERSPSERFTIVRGSARDEGTGDTADGIVAVLEGDTLRALCRVHRPHQARVADNGAFVVTDWMQGGTLNGRFLGCRPDGSIAFAQEFDANVGASAISADGAYAVCQTYRSPDSADSCVTALFDLGHGVPLSRFRTECVTAQSFEFDLTRSHLHAIAPDGDREVYGLDGVMIDRPGWVARRLESGDLRIIGNALRDGPPAAGLEAGIRRGLASATSAGENWQRAKAYRLEGELEELLGNRQAALAAYESALKLDPQVGVARRADALGRGLAGASDKSGRRISTLERQAERLGIHHEIIELLPGADRLWRPTADHSLSAIEEAALGYYVAEGWSGAATEGGLILTLIKAASFAHLPTRNADTFIEALYAQNVAFDEDRFDPKAMIATIRSTTLGQLERNWRIISATAGSSPAYYPGVNWDGVVGLFGTLGADRLAGIASVFATAPYDLRAGWPDLTLWRDGEVRFVEVKSPRDRMHASQANMISNLLLPLDFHVTLAEVRPRA